MNAVDRLCDGGDADVAERRDGLVDVAERVVLVRRHVAVLVLLEHLGGTDALARFGIAFVLVFLLLGIPMILFGATYGAWKWWSYARAGGFAALGEVMLAAMPIILGVQLVIQAVVLDVQNVPNTPISPPLRRR
jgi:hypothetical protein